MQVTMTKHELLTRRAPDGAATQCKDRAKTLSGSQGLTTLFRKSHKDVLQQKQYRKPRKQPLWGPSNTDSSPGDAENSRKEAVSGVRMPGKRALSRREGVTEKLGEGEDKGNAFSN